MKLNPYSLFLPTFGIPPSPNTVSVSIVNTTTNIAGLPGSQFFTPDIPGNLMLAVPSWSFLIQHPKLKRNLLFDLGMRKDWQNLAPSIVPLIQMAEIIIEKDVKQVLTDGGFNPSSLEALIWSHWHFDHVGNPSTFDKKTALIVGPGFKANLLPGYPANPNGSILESDYAGRELREITFDSKDKGVVRIGQFRGYDYFGDGSYYLLDAPGHTIGHLAGLARVTSNPDSFIFMGGDSAHHGGELRPSAYLPLPKNVSPNPFTSISAPSAPCPGEIFESILRNGDKTKPIYVPTTTGIHYNGTEAALTIAKVQAADAYNNILVAVAHDQTLNQVVDFFPKTANNFVKKGWVAKAKWLFLRDFAEAVGYKGKVEGRSWLWEKYNLPSKTP